MTGSVSYTLAGGSGQGGRHIEARGPTAIAGAESTARTRLAPEARQRLAAAITTHRGRSAQPRASRTSRGIACPKCVRTGWGARRARRPDEPFRRVFLITVRPVTKAPLRLVASLVAGEPGQWRRPNEGCDAAAVAEAESTTRTRPTAEARRRLATDMIAAHFGMIGQSRESRAA